MEQSTETQYVAIVQASREPIMVSNAENALLSDLKSKEGVVTIPLADYLESLEEDGLTSEDRAMLLEKVETLVMLDKVDGSMLEMVAEKMKRKQQDMENLAMWEQEVNSKGYTIANNSGTLKRLDKKIGRNDYCPCGSGLKFKKCHLSSVKN